MKILNLHLIAIGYINKSGCWFDFSFFFIYRACNFHCISVQWAKPLEYGDATIYKYNVFVNDEIVSVQSADQTSFTFTDGVSCTDYTFQVKVKENFISKLIRRTGHVLKK